MRDPNPDIRCMICNLSETELEEIFNPLENGMICEADNSDYLIAIGQGIDAATWIAERQAFLGNTIGIHVPPGDVIPDAPAVAIKEGEVPDFSIAPEIPTEPVEGEANG